MAAFVIWLVIIFVVVAVNRKSTRGKTVTRPNVPRQQQTGSAGGQRGAAVGGQKGTPGTRQSTGPVKNNRPISGSGDILSRAKASVEEDFGQTWDQEERLRQERRKEESSQERRKEEISQERRKEEGRQQKALRVVIDERKPEGPAGEKRSEPEMSQMPGELPALEGNLDLEAVYDLMVKGPNLELTFERDFLGEGLDMLNRIQE